MGESATPASAGIALAAVTLMALMPACMHDRVCVSSEGSKMGESATPASLGVDGKQNQKKGS
eukprot:1142957-Pelagomonas_calceolata.AAC.5